MWSNAFARVPWARHADVPSDPGADTDRSTNWNFTS